MIHPLHRLRILGLRAGALADDDRCEPALGQQLHQGLRLRAELSLRKGPVAFLAPGGELDAGEVDVEALDEAGYGDMTLCPETMGKIGQLGTLDEVLALCGVDKRITPCIDFGHLNARTLGGIQSRADYAAILDRMDEVLGDERARRFHVHFSRIEFSAGGEKRHWTFAETQFGPEPQPLMELLSERRLEPVIICESAGTQAEDAQAMQRMYEAARGEQPLRQR